MFNNLDRKIMIRLLGIFSLFAVLALGLGLINPKNLLCVDPYFYIKRADLIRQGEAIWDFPQLPLISKNFLFWMSPFFSFLLVPFTFGNLFWGAKIALGVANGAIFALFYYILKNNKIHWPFFWCLLLFFISSPFLFRLQLLRPHLISIFCLLLLVNFLIFSRNNLGIFWVSLILVLFYHFPYYLPILLVSYLITSLITKTKIYWSSCLAFILGTLAGFIIAPNIKERLYQFYWIFKIPYLINIQKLNLHFGGEIYPASVDILSTVLPLGAILAVLLPALWYQRNLVSQTEKRVFLFLFFTSTLFFILMLKGQRFVEYFVPTTVLMISYIAGKILVRLPVSLQWKKFLGETKIKLIIILGGIIVVLAAVGSVYKSSRDDEYKQALLSASEWLKQNNQADKIIFHNSWSDFPILFFKYPAGRYILGMDPTSLYASNKNLYWQWYNLSLCGIVSTNSGICDALLKHKEEREKFIQTTTDAEIAQALQSSFSVHYILISHWQNSLLEERLRDNHHFFKEEYQNNLVKIYSLE